MLKVHEKEYFYNFLSPHDLCSSPIFIRSIFVRSLKLASSEKFPERKNFFLLKTFAPRFQGPKMVSKRTSLSLSDCLSSNFNPQSSNFSSLPRTMTTISLIAITCLLLPGFVSSSIYYQKPPLARFASQGPPGEYNHPIARSLSRFRSTSLPVLFLTCIVSYLCGFLPVFFLTCIFSYL